MNQNQKLDFVLNFLYKQKEKLSIKSIAEQSKISEEIKNDLVLILNKLVRDNYIDYSYDSSGKELNENKYFFINFDGKFLFENGGYARLKRHQDWKPYKAVLLSIFIAVVSTTLGALIQPLKELFQSKSKPQQDIYIILPEYSNKADTMNLRKSKRIEKVK